MPLYRIKNWEKFQHYKDRTPPWIRLHRALLDNYEYHCLPDASKALAPLLWLLASENPDPGKGEIEASDEKIAFRLHMTIGKLRDSIKSLIENGFIELVADASNLLAGCEHGATPETETDSTETDTALLPPVLTKMPFTDIPPEWKLQAIEEMGWPENVVLDVWEGFREYWQNGKGKKTKRENWLASWGNWYRKERFNLKGDGYARPTRKSTLDILREGTERARAARERGSTGQAG